MCRLGLLLNGPRPITDTVAMSFFFPKLTHDRTYLSLNDIPATTAAGAACSRYLQLQRSRVALTHRPSRAITSAHPSPPPPPSKHPPSPTPTRLIDHHRIQTLRTRRQQASCTHPHPNPEVFFLASTGDAAASHVIPVSSEVLPLPTSATPWPAMLSPSLARVALPSWSFFSLLGDLLLSRPLLTSLTHTRARVRHGVGANLVRA
jgi:hypothetical protein